MKLLAIRLQNFQGIKSLEVKLDGKEAHIYGANASGKTTIFNAFTYLMTGKASTNEKGYTPKTTDSHQLEHSVECDFLLKGKPLTLKRLYKEVYTRQRGSTVDTFTGHTTLYYIDGVSVAEKEYQEYLKNNVATDETMKLLTMPDYFAEVISWKDRRQVLMDMYGDITAQEVVDAEEELDGFIEMLNGKLVEDFKNIAVARRTKLNNDIQAIPNRIDEAERAKPDVANVSEESIDNDIMLLNIEREALEKRKSDVSVSGLSEAKAKVSEVVAELAQARADYTTIQADTVYKVNDELNAKIRELKSSASEYNSKIQDEDRRIEVSKTLIAEKHRGIGALERSYEEAKNEQFDEAKSSCPVCKRDYPGDDVAEMKANFNQVKSTKLESITGLINGAKTEIQSLEATIEEATNKKSELQASELKIESDISEINTKFVDVVPFEQTLAYNDIFGKLNKHKMQVHTLSENLEVAVKAIADEIAVVNSKIEAKRDLKSSVKMVEAQNERIKELKADEKRLASEYQKAEREVHLCDLFIKTKVTMLDEKINSKFHNLRFRLFVEQINGGFKEDCEVLIPSKQGVHVPFSSANNAGRINAGLEIIDTLSKHWGIELPVFVDNAEGVTDLSKLDMQVTRLVVAAGFEAPLTVGKELTRTQQDNLAKIASYADVEATLDIEDNRFTEWYGIDKDMFDKWARQNIKARLVKETEQERS